MTLYQVFAGASAAIYAALALGWLIQVFRHRQEAVKMHWLLVLYPLCGLLPTLLTFSFEIGHTPTDAMIINSVVGMFLAAGAYIVLGLAASGYSVVILPTGQMLTIASLAAFMVFLSGMVVKATWVSFLVLILEIVQFVYLVRVAIKFNVEAGHQHPAHAGQGRWLISAADRVEVAKRTLRAIWVYVIGIIVIVIITTVVEYYAIYDVTSNASQKTQAELAAELQEKIEATLGPLMLAQALLSMLVFLMLAFAYQLGRHHHGYNHEQAGLLAPNAQTEAGIPVQTYQQTAPAYQPTGETAYNGQPMYQPAYGQPSAPQY